MKKLVTFFCLITLLGAIYLYRKEIITALINNLSSFEKEITLESKNVYYRNYNFSYVKNTDDFSPNSKEDLLNMYYTIINSGVDEFSFHCDESYDTCIDDVLYLANNQSILSNINSFVHPFNSFTTIKTKYNPFNKVTIQIQKTYSEEDINRINQEVDRIIKEEIKNETNPKKIIRIIHNYIINNTKYDKDRADRNIIKYKSNTAYGVLLEKYGLCGGYTDAMAIFLNKYNIPNFKVVSDNHIWNAVYIDEDWYHLDLTWDDPVLTDGSNTLEYTFFLITTEELEELQTNQHYFDKKVFLEISN